MGPRLDSRGSGGPGEPPSIDIQLQWGRGWTAAEVTGRLLLGVFGEPLQWGRAWTAAEVGSDANTRVWVYELQWGRGWTAAEVSRPLFATRRGRSFNGAAAGQPRKSSVPHGAALRPRASMGPRLDSRGSAAPRPA